jgi:AAA+ superfamily predicted ATPase
MARSDLLINLVKAGVSGDTGTFNRTVDAIVAEERAKQHNVVADQLERVVRTTNGNGPSNVIRHAPESGHRARDFISEIMPRRRLDDLVLPETTLLATKQLIEEQQRGNLLRSHSLEPRHRILLVGPPGNGKTTLAEAIAESLAVPFFVVRYEGMIGSFLGETAARLKRVFEYARTTPCVLFFDEFDAVGKERGDKHETGEIKRVVTSLLMQIDDLPSYVVVIAATNHAELLDRAVWRRFQLRLPLPAPSLKQLADYIEQLAKKNGSKAWCISGANSQTPWSRQLCRG